jgi:transposase
MQATMTCVGLDVHARSTHAAAIDVVSGELRRVRFGQGTEEVVSWLSGLAAPVRAAGPTGFGLARSVTAVGVEMLVAAPSKTPRAKGDRVKSDRKDAELLARLLLAGQLTAVVVPPAWLEAIRHLARTREQIRRDLARARHRVSKLLLVEGRVYPGKTTWNWAHHQWLASQQFEFESTELAFVDLMAAVDGLLARRQALDERLSGGDWHRFPSPRKLSSWRGLVPSLDQSGESLAQGSITKTGSSIARRLLVEAAWHYARTPRIGVAVQNRQAGQPDHILQIAWKAQHRLHRVHKRIKARGKPANVATIAVARELAAFLWAAATAP